MHATFVLKCGKCGLRMQQCNVIEICTMFMTFIPYFVIFILI